jgi:hypothetical protein
LKTKNPLRRWASRPAISITEITAAQASDVKRPHSLRVVDAVPVKTDEGSRSHRTRHAACG